MEASASVDDAQLEPGEWVNVTYRLENTGDEDYTYQHPGCPPARLQGIASGPAPAVDIYRYRDEAQAGPCMIRNVTVEAGSSVNGTVNWNGHLQEDAPDPHGGERASEGTYTLTVEIVRSDDGPVFPAEVTVEVTG
jgi:hypothetical protein